MELHARVRFCAAQQLSCFGAGRRFLRPCATDTPQPWPQSVHGRVRQVLNSALNDFCASLRNWGGGFLDEVVATSAIKLQKMLHSCAAPMRLARKASPLVRCGRRSMYSCTWRCKR